MKHIKSINEYVKAKLLPRELRNNNLLYHSTKMEFLDNILKTNKLYGTHGYDYGVATSRNKHYAYGTQSSSDFDGDWGYNSGDIQFILDRDKIKTKYKIDAFDWEEMKLNKNKTSEYSDHVQSEDKIMTNVIDNFADYVIGIHIVHNDFKYELLGNEMFLKYVNNHNWIIFDENWDDVTQLFKHS